MIDFSFRAQAKKFFLTFPKCEVSTREIMRRVLIFTPTVKVGIVARELHKDGTHHIHVFLEMVNKYDCKNSRKFDCLTPGSRHHCNISTVRNAHATLKYITKDFEYELYGITQKTLDIILSGTSYSLGEVAAAIIENPNVQDIATKYPTHFIHYSNGIEKLIGIVRTKNATQTTPFIYPIQLSDEALEEIDNHQILLGWFKTNFLDSAPKPLRSPQLWLHGSTQLGKSRFIAFLRKHWQGYLIPPRENYYNNYTDEDVYFLFHDEFYGGKQVTFMNDLLGGAPVNMPSKGGQYVKNRNKPVVICSNLSPGQAYSKLSIQRPIMFNAFVSRLLTYDLDVEGQIHDFIDILEGNFPTKLSCYNPIE